MKALFAFIALAGLGFSATFALKCYNCQETKECSDPFKANNTLTTSSSNCVMCTKGKVEVNGVASIYRGCITKTELPADVGANECKKSGNNVACLCDKDLCNHGNTIEMKLTKTVLLGVFILILKYVYM